MADAPDPRTPTMRGKAGLAHVVPHLPKPWPCAQPVPVASAQQSQNDPAEGEAATDEGESQGRR